MQTSARYQSLTPTQRAQIDRVANALCSGLAAIQLTLAQMAQLLNAYDDGVAALVRTGWLT
jgi:hypothetical protein